MRTVLILLAALVALATSVRAESPPLQLPSIPADRPNFSAADNPLQISLMRILHAFLALAAPPPASFKLAIQASALPSPVTDLIVGNDALLSLAQSSLNAWQARPPFDLKPQWDFIRRQTASPSPIQRLLNVFDVQEDQRPWATTTSVHLLAGAAGRLIPYAAMAREVDVDEDLQRYGLGAGAMFMLSKHASIGAELMYFGGDHARTNDNFDPGTRFFAHLQIEF